MSEGVFALANSTLIKVTLISAQSRALRTLNKNVTNNDMIPVNGHFPEAHHSTYFILVKML